MSKALSGPESFPLFLNPVVRPQGHLIGGGKVFRDGLCDLSCGTPLGSPQEEGLETRTLHGGIIVQAVSAMAKHDMENPSRAILHSEDERLLTARASLLG